MTQPWKKQLHRKLLASTAIMVGASIALPVIGATTHSAQAANIKVDGTTQTSADTSFDDNGGTASAIEVTNNGKLTLTGDSITASTAAYPNDAAYVHNGSQLIIDNDIDASNTNGVNGGGTNALNVDGVNSSITLHGSANITSKVRFGFGIQVTNNGTFTADNANKTITINNTYSPDGISSSPSAINLDNGTTFTSAGTVTINSTTKGITMNNGWSVVGATGGTAQFNNLNITTSTPSGIGIDVRGQGQFTVNTLHLETQGGVNAYGVLSSNAGTLITIGDGSITTSAPDPDNYAEYGSSALRARDHGAINVTGTITLDTSVVSSEGVNATGGAAITLNNTNITTHSDISDGVAIGRLYHPWEYGDNGAPNSTVTSNGDLNITTDKATSFGIRLTGDGANLQTGANSSATIHSAGTAVKFQTGDNQSVTLQNATITSDGLAGVYAIDPTLNPADTNQINDYAEFHQAVNNDGNLFQVGGKDNIQNYVSGSGTNSVYNTFQDNSTNSSLTLTNSIASAGGGKLLMDVRSSGDTGSTFTFNNDHTELHGGVATQAGSTLAMNLTNGSSWYIDQNSNLTNLTNDGSSIIFDNNNTFKSLTTSGNYTAANNGSILFNTQLGDNSSPTDTLVVNGDVIGNTGVYVANAGGGGGQTTGNGIQLIDATSTTNTSFSLQNAVNAGLYSYNLFRGGITPNVATDNDWFLRSTYSSQAAATAAVPGMSFQVVLSMLPNLHDIRPNVDYYYDEDNSDNSDKNKQAQLPATTPANIQNASFRNDYGAPTLQYALYNPGSNAAQPQQVAFPQGNVNTSVQEAPARKGVWARFVGQDLKFESNDAAGSGFDGNIWGVQAGIDLYAKAKNDGSRQYLGAYLSNASSSGDSLSNAGKVGTVDLDATSVGLYYTKTSPEGWYLNGLAQYSWIHNVEIQTETGTATPNGSSAALSLEAGKQLNPDKNFIWEPQVQLIYSHNSLDDVTVSGSPTIQVADLNAVTGRIGLRLSQNPRTAKKFLPWFSANIWNTFSSNSQISSGDSTLQTPIGGTVGELAIGFSTRPGNAGGWSFNASVGGDFSLAGAHYSGVKGSLGLRKSW
jgi:outer membrane autotransporter protein